MKHEPTAAEQLKIDALLERLRFEFVPVRLTKTMLEKSIIDARAPLRYLLARNGIVDFETIPQGTDHKVQLGLPLAVGRGFETRRFSFYRPNTKSGDPRIWIERLTKQANAEDLLLFVFANSNVAAVVLSGSVEDLVAAISQIAPSRFEERSGIEDAVGALSGEIHKLRNRWIRTQRKGPTGVGYTLESILGIKANTSKKADVGGVELKAYRRGAVTGPGKLVSLFSEVPTHWFNGLTPVSLVQNYGYNRLGRRQLYCTITQTANRLGFSLETAAEESRMHVAHAKERLVSYAFDTLEQRLQEKHPSTLFIRATCRGRGADEEFCYDELIYCREPSFPNFLDLIGEDRVGLDFTLSLKPNGRTRDHGYLWRIREASIPTLYGYRRVLAAPEAN